MNLMCCCLGGFAILEPESLPDCHWSYLSNGHVHCTLGLAREAMMLWLCKNAQGSAGQGYTCRVQGWDSYLYPSRVWIWGNGYGYCTGFLGVQQKTCKKRQNLGFWWNIRFIADQIAVGSSLCKLKTCLGHFRVHPSNFLGFLRAASPMIYAKNIEKTPKNDVFDVSLLKKNTGSTREGTS